MIDQLIEILRTVALGYTNAYYYGLIDFPGLMDDKLDLVAQFFISMTGSG
jgi:hypothetical protein